MNNRRRSNKRSEAAKARRRLNKAIRETDKLDPEYLRRTIIEYMEMERKGETTTTTTTTTTTQ